MSLAFQRRELHREVLVRSRYIAQLYESADDKNAHFYCGELLSTVAAMIAPVFREGERKLAPTALT